jgi:hypothetical protein
VRDIISFSLPGSDSLHDLQLGQTLIRFTEFDSAFFKDQSLGAYRNSTPDDFVDRTAHLKEYLHTCHPYCKALLNADFDKIALDCVVNEICLQEGIGLEALWVRSMARQDRLGQEIFRRITDYKTGRAINQWTNLIRMQSYAMSKMTYIYGGEEMDAATHRARKLYYDLMFMLTAAELGFGTDNLPRAEISSAPYLTQVGAVMKTAVNALTPVVKELTGGAAARTAMRGDECVRDQMAGIVINAMAGIKPPEDEDIDLLARRYGGLSYPIYVPSGMKAVLDLEFDQMLEKGFYIRIDGDKRTRMKYTSKKDVSERRGNSVTAAEKPARPETVIETPVKESAPPEKVGQTEDKAPEEARSVETEEPGIGQINVAADAEINNTGKVSMIIELAEDPGRIPSRDRTLQEVNSRCNLIWMSMNVKTGWSITPEDASSWFRYLTRLRFGIGKGELTPESLDKFLDATLEVYKLLPENMN